jgi:hypothetical protein
VLALLVFWFHEVESFVVVEGRVRLEARPAESLWSRLSFPSYEVPGALSTKDFATAATMVFACEKREVGVATSTLVNRFVRLPELH